MSLSYRNQVFWPVYITRANLDVKIRYCQNWPAILFLSFIFIDYKQVKDLNNKDKDLKTKIYFLTLKIILKHI